MLCRESLSTHRRDGPANHDSLDFEMIFVSPTALWGWLSLALLAVVVAIPYLRRTTVVAQAADMPRPYLSALSAHYWLALTVFIVSFVHAWIPMAAGHIPQTSMRGLWLATYALGLLLLQLAFGLALRFGHARTVRALRYIHFLLMLGIAALVLAHVWLNGPFRPSL